MSPKIWVAAGVLLLGTWTLVEVWRLREPTVAPPSEPRVRSVLLGKNPRWDDLSVLEQVSWPEVEPTLNQLLGDSMARDRAILEMGQAQAAPAVFMRAFLLAGRDEIQSAWTALSPVAPEEVPAGWVYAAWRLGTAAGEGLGNRFLPAAVAAADAGAITGLAAGRVWAASGQWESALAAYHSSDPADWREIDGALLAQGRRLAGWELATGRLVMAALKGGRVPAELQPRLAAQLAPATEEDRDEALWAEMQTAAAQDPSIARAMAAAAQGQVELRQLFAAGRHEEVTARCAQIAPSATGDETVLLAVLSAAAIRDREAWQRWSDELARRNPRQQVVSWLARIRSETGL